MKEIFAFYIGLLAMIVSICIITVLIYVDLGDNLLIQIIRGFILGSIVGYSSAGLAKWVYNKLKD